MADKIAMFWLFFLAFLLVKTAWTKALEDDGLGAFLGLIFGILTALATYRLIPA